MERRRLQFTGGTSYTVTLPKDWVVSNGLQKNDPLSVTRLGNDALIVRPCGSQASSPLRSITIKGSDLDLDTLHRRIIGSYVYGYSEIVIDYPDVPEEVTGYVKRVTDSLMGMTIDSFSKDGIVLKDHSDIEELSPVKSIGRMKVSMRNILNDICNNMKLGIHMGALHNRDTEVDRIRLLLSRQANIMHASPFLYSKVGVIPKKMSTLVNLAAIIEDIGDVCVSMNNTLKNIRDRAAIEDVAHLMDYLNITGMFVTVTDSVLNNSLEVAEKSIVECKKAEGRIVQSYEISARYDLKDALAVNTLAESIRKILGFERDICELAIDTSIPSSVE